MQEEEYSKLLDTQNSLDSDESDSLDIRTQYILPPLLRWVAAAVVIIGIIDTCALVYVTHMFNTVFRPKDFASRLQYGNPYIGLQDLYSSGKVNSSAIDPIVLRPRSSAQVFVDEPDRVSPRGLRDTWKAGWGTVSPNERHLHVTPITHTIVQYRTIDFGMEDCHLVLTLPEPGVSLEAGASSNVTLSSRITVFRLAAEHPVDVKTLSYRTRPKVSRGVAVRVQPGIGGDTLLHRFPCPSASLHVFEIACADGSDCLLDVWSSQNTTYGINILQHQTV
ncbi:hypothetical protein BD311DRAFT_724083 [Dichomitus squalens]|uniref:Ubiquitin 3 binding protein But2 C-terminal domain-containing protein n=1 Tax=Dichomitus squalens TaxID=114155 RepID=A0A4Q9MJ45_9APHY|nr:hypothetical protein BD311DRAFT_724083 [Dichomitus squalens]